MPRNRQTLDQQQPAVAVLDVLDQAPRPAAPRPAAPPPEPLPIPESIVRRNGELRDAELMLERKVDGAEIPPDQESYLGWLFGNEFQIAHQLQRVRRRRVLQRQASSGDVRQAAKALAERAAAELAVEGPRLQEQIAALQRQLTAIEEAAAAAAAQVERHDAALAGLTDFTLLDDAARPAFERARKNWETTYGRPARSLRNQAEGMLLRAGWDPTNDADRIANYSQSNRELQHLVVVKIVEGASSPFVRGQQPEIRDRRFVTTNIPAWETHVCQLRARAADLAAEAERLETEGQPAKAELDAMLAALIPS